MSAPQFSRQGLPCQSEFIYLHEIERLSRTLDECTDQQERTTLLYAESTTAPTCGVYYDITMYETASLRFTQRNRICLAEFVVIRLAQSSTLVSSRVQVLSVAGHLACCSRLWRTVFRNTKIMHQEAARKIEVRWDH